MNTDKERRTLEFINSRQKPEDLLDLPLTPPQAHALFQYRGKYGNLASLDELLKVRGIGKRTLEKIKDWVPQLKPKEQEQFFIRQQDSLENRQNHRTSNTKQKESTRGETVFGIVVLVAVAIFVGFCTRAIFLDDQSERASSTPSQSPTPTSSSNFQGISPQERLQVRAYGPKNTVRFGFYSPEEYIGISFGKSVFALGTEGSISVNRMDMRLPPGETSISRSDFLMVKTDNYAYFYVSLDNFTSEKFYVEIRAESEFIYEMQRTGEEVFEVLRCWTGRSALKTHRVAYSWISVFHAAAEKVERWGCEHNLDLLVLSPGYSSKDWKRDIYKEPYAIQVVFGEQLQGTHVNPVGPLTDPTLYAKWGYDNRYLLLKIHYNSTKTYQAQINALIDQIVASIAISTVEAGLDPASAPFARIHILEEKYSGWFPDDTKSALENIMAACDASESRHHDFDFVDLINRHREDLAETPLPEGQTPSSLLYQKGI